MAEPEINFTLYIKRLMHNKLLCRKQMALTAFHNNKAAPSKEQILQEVAKKFKADPNTIVIYGEKSKFGGGKTGCFCFIYDTFELRKKLDTIPNQRKLKLRTKKTQIRKIRKSLRRRQKTVRGVAKTKVQAGAKKQKKKKE
jgi:small subunit ribosomal protein S24e